MRFYRCLLTLLALALLFAVPTLSGQPYIEGGKTRHRFAQLLVGMDASIFPAAASTFKVGTAGQIEPYETGAALVPRLHIGGTHFWGHANFYLSIPVGNVLNRTIPDGGRFAFNPGVETGFRVYPWRIEEAKVRPFGGVAFSVTDWQQESPLGTGSVANRTRIPIQAGITYQRGNTLFELGVGRFFRNQMTYFVDRTRSTEIELSPHYLWLGMAWQLETTLSAEADHLDGTTADLVERLEQRKALSAWSIGAGISAAFVLGDAPRNAVLFPAIGRHSTPPVYVDLGLGYYYYPWDTHLNLAFRSNGSDRAAYGEEQRISRLALTLEAYKFLFDFHGFVPFIGPHLSRERLTLTEKRDETLLTEETSRQWAPGITFGWDIRPNALQQFVLRTNLRYTPTRKIGEEGGVSFRQLEFNFIQLVLYPGRVRKMSNALRN